MSLFSWMSVFKYNFGLLTIQNKIDDSIWGHGINFCNCNENQFGRNSIVGSFYFRPQFERVEWWLKLIWFALSITFARKPQISANITSYVFNIAYFYAEVSITLASCDWEWAPCGFKPRGVHSLFSILIWNFYGINWRLWRQSSHKLDS